jgi:AcrR family transcriptional regulator
MTEEKVDRRVKYTKRVLRESLLELMQEHPINKITVTEICRRADINRNTFYMHYNSQFDLLSSIEDSFLEEIKNAVERSLNTGVFDGLVSEICQYIEENGNLCKILFSDHGNGDYLKRIIYIFHDRSIAKWLKEASHIDSNRFEAMYSFISSGSSAIIHEWVKNGMLESPKNIAQFVEKAIFAVEQAFMFE